MPPKQSDELKTLLQQLIYPLTAFQASQMKIEIDKYEAVGQSTFVDMYFSIAGSVTMHRERLENKLRRLFDLCDRSKDGTIDSSALPLSEVMERNTSFSATREDILRYNDVPYDVPVPPGGDWLWDDVSLVQYHETIGLYSLCVREGVVLVSLSGVKLTIVARLMSHKAPVVKCLHVPHLAKFVTSGADRKLNIWLESERWALGETIRSPTTILSMTLDCHALHLVAGGSDGYVYIFPMVPVLTEFKKRVKAHNDWVTDVKVLPDLGRVATCSVDRTLSLWDRYTLVHRASKQGADKAILQMGYSDQFRTIVGVVGRDLLMYSPFLPTKLEKLTGHDKPIVGVTTFPRASETISVETSGRVMVWDVTVGKAVQSLGAPESKNPIGSVMSMCYNTDKSAIICVGRKFSVFYALEGTSTALLDNKVRHVAYAAAYRSLVVAMGARIFIFEAFTGRLLGNHGGYSNCEISALACIGEDDGDLVVGNVDGDVKSIPLSTGNVEREVKLPEVVRYIFDVGEGNRIASRSPGSRRAVVVMDAGQYIEYPYTARDSPPPVVQRTGIRCLFACGFSQQQGLLAVAEKRKLELWDVLHCCWRTNIRYTSYVTSILFSDTMNTLFTTTSVGTLYCYTLPSLAPVCIVGIKDHFAPTYLHFSPATWCLYAHREATCQLWCMRSLTEAVVRRRQRFPFKFRKPVVLNGDFEVESTMIGKWPIPGRMISEKRAVTVVGKEATAEGGAPSFEAIRSVLDRLEAVQRVFAPPRAPPLIAAFVHNHCPVAVYDHIVGVGCKNYFDELRLERGKSINWLEELRWWVRDVIIGLKAYHDKGLTLFLCFDDVFCVTPHWVVRPHRGVFEDNNCGCEPEELVGSRSLLPLENLDVSPTIDMWLFGHMLFELMTGHPAFFSAMTNDERRQRLSNKTDIFSPSEVCRYVREGLRGDDFLMQILHRVLDRDTDTRWSVDDVLGLYDRTFGDNPPAAPDYHLCIPLPRMADDQEALVSKTVDVAGVHRFPDIPLETTPFVDGSTRYIDQPHFSAVTFGYAPQVMFCCEFNGNSSRIVLRKLVEREAIGILPLGEDGTDVQWTADVYERDYDHDHASQGRKKFWAKRRNSVTGFIEDEEQTEALNNAYRSADVPVDRCCPFYTEQCTFGFEQPPVDRYYLMGTKRTQEKQKEMTMSPRALQKKFAKKIEIATHLTAPVEVIGAPDGPNVVQGHHSRRNAKMEALAMSMSSLERSGTNGDQSRSDVLGTFQQDYSGAELHRVLTQPQELDFTLFSRPPSHSERQRIRQTVKPSPFPHMAPHFSRRSVQSSVKKKKTPADIIGTLPSIEKVPSQGGMSPGAGQSK